ncbi:MAG: hypothetical protein H3C28_01360 [Sphingomonadales bacterium]|nr:hypothetical protein [Sphingomonadales bacterium]
MMQHNHSTPNTYDPKNQEISIAEILGELWKNKSILLFSIFSILLLSILYLHIATYKYTAEIKIYPVQSPSGNGISRQLGGLASLAGVNLQNSQQGSPFELYSEEIYSREIANILSADHKLMRVIYRSEWDPETSQWKHPKGILSSLIAPLKAILGVPSREWQAPNGARLQDYIKANVKLEENPRKSTVTINYTNPDPQFAVRFVNTLHKATDERLRQRALERSTKYINYLSNKLQSTTVTEYRAALVAILSDQEKLSMIASSNVPYAAESLGSAIASLKPTQPRPHLVLMAGVSIGLIVGILIVLARCYVFGDIQKQSTPSPLS